jgi:hypothetical protein
MVPRYIAAAVNNFFPSVVSTLGYSRNITYCLTARKFGAKNYDIRICDTDMPLLSTAPFVLCVFVIILNGMHSDKTQEVSLNGIVAKHS